MLPPDPTDPAETLAEALDALVLHDAQAREDTMRAEADLVGLEDGDPCQWWAGGGR